MDKVEITDLNLVSFLRFRAIRLEVHCPIDIHDTGPTFNILDVSGSVGSGIPIQIY